MQYDNYDLKMQKVAKVFKLILKLIPVVVIIGALITAMVATLLATKGIIKVDEEPFPTEIVYGDELGYNASAFLSKVDYEYSKAGTGDWSRDFPTAPGSYRVRAVAKATFGYRYGAEASFTISERPITVEVAEGNVIYGEAPKLSADLAFGDKITEAEFTYNGDRTSAEAIVSSLKIEDEKGNDVTASYIIAVKEGAIKTLKRPVTLDSLSAEKVYDGEVLTSEKYEISAGTLAYSDTAEISFTASVTDAGETANSFGYKFLDADGGDVTKYYTVVVNEGVLKVTARPITVATSDASVIYDGKAHSQAGYELTDGMGLVEGHTIEEISYSSITSVGNSENVLTLAIRDGEGRDVTNNYGVSSDWGTLTVTKRPITVKTESFSNVYNGKSQKAHSYDIISEYGLCEEHILKGSDWAHIVNVGELENSFTARIYDGESEVTQNYEITYEKGTLSVTPREITVTTESPRYEYIGEMRSHVAIVISGMGLVENHLTEIYNETVVLDAGEYENKLEIRIYKDKTEVTDNYKIDYVYGTVVVDKRPVTVITGSSENILYDGKQHHNTGYDSQQLIKGHSIEVRESAAIIDVGERENEFISYVILDGEKNDVTKNYDVTFENGILSVIKRPVLIFTDSAEKIYDGKVLTAPDWVVSDKKHPLVDGHTLDATAPTGSQKNAGSSPNTYEGGVIIRDGDGRDVSANYDIELAVGTLTVHKRPIDVNFADISLFYDGKYHSDSGIYAHGSYGLCEYHSFKFDENDVPSFKNVKDSGIDVNFFPFIIIDENGENVRENYAISYDYGDVSIKPRPITLITQSTGDSPLIYDGEAHYFPGIEVSATLGMGLCEGHSVSEGEAYGFINAKPQGYSNVIAYDILDENGESVIENYSTTDVYGRIVILPRPIRLTTPSAEFVYDGILHMEYYEVTVDTGNGYYGLVKGHSLIKGNYNGFIDANPDGYINAIEVTVYDGNVEVTSNYEITYEYGKIVIFKRAISVWTEGDSFVYDGIAHTYPDVHVDPLGKYQLCAGHDLLPTAVFAFEYVSHSGENKVEFDIIDATSGESVIKNYDISATYGYVTVRIREVYINTHSGDWIYDGERHFNHGYTVTKGSFVDFHNVTVSGEKSAWIKNVGSVNNTLVINVYAGENDVTENYKITVSKTGTLKVTPRPIEVISDSDEKVYDGTPLEKHSLSVAPDSAYKLAEGHKLSATFTGTITNAGTVNNTYHSVKITDENGEDVTENYSILKNKEGTLTVHRRKIAIESGSATKQYDGTPLTKHSFVIPKNSPNSKVSGHTIEAIFSGEQIDVGESPNTFDEGSVKIKDSDGNDVTANYEIVEMICGTLTVKGGSGGGGGGGGGGSGSGNGGGLGNLDMSGKPTPPSGGGNGGGGNMPACFIVTASKTGKMYLKLFNYGDYQGDCWGLAPEYDSLILDKASASYLTAYALQAFAAEQGMNVSYVKIQSMNGEYVVPYYSLDVNCEIQTSDVYVQGDTSAEYTLCYFDWTYTEGMTVPEALKEFEEQYYKFVCENYLDIDLETYEYMQGIIKQEGFDINDPEVIAKIASYIQHAATYNMEFNGDLNNESNIAVAFLETYKEGVCWHYATSATMLYRALGLPARMACGYAADAEAEVAVEVTGMNAHAWVEVYIKDLGWICVEVTGGGSGGGSSEGEGEGEGEGEEIEGGEDGGSSDDGNKSNTITVTPINISKTYDGTPLYHTNQIENDPVLSRLLKDGYTFEVIVSGFRTDIGSSPCTVESFILRDFYGNDVTGQFTIVKNTGTLTVYATEGVTIFIPSKVVDFDGAYHSFDADEYFILSCAPNLRLELTEINISLKYVGGISSSMINGDIQRYITYRLYDKTTGKDVTAQYPLEVAHFDSSMTTYDVITVNRRALEITTASATKEYDGKPLVKNSFTVSMGNLPEGFKIELTILGSITEVGISENFVNLSSLRIYDEKGNDVTANFTCTVVLGVLTVE